MHIYLVAHTDIIVEYTVRGFLICNPSLSSFSPRVQWPDRDKIPRQLTRPAQLQHGPARQDLQQGRRKGQRALGCRG